MLKVDRVPLLPLMGNTPLYSLPELAAGEVLVKIESGNPGGSIKDRAAWGMLRSLEQQGKLNEHTVLVEPTSGNTGIGLALFGCALGLRVILTMPESMSVERRTILRTFGAELILTPAAEGMRGAVRRAEEVLQEMPHAIMPDQFSNPGNPWAHRLTTGPEILTELRGRAPVALVAGVGTGGTISGTGRALRNEFPDMRIIALEPARSPVLGGGAAGAHGIQGIGAGFVPGNFDAGLVDEILPVEDDAARETALWLARRHGLFCGISTGANVWAAMEVAKRDPQGGAVVTFAPDRGDRYLSVFAE